MSKYIDAEDITSTIRKVRTKFAIDSVFGENLREDAAVAGALEAVAQVIDILPAADVVKVVRCRECKHRKDEQPSMVYCPCMVGGWVDENWFCAGGEKE